MNTINNKINVPFITVKAYIDTCFYVHSTTRPTHSTHTARPKVTARWKTAFIRLLAINVPVTWASNFKVCRESTCTWHT